MADFTSDLHSFKPSFPFLEIDPNMDLMSQFSSSVLHPSLMEPSSNMNNLRSLMEFSQENFFNPQQQSIGFPGNLLENFPGIFSCDDQKNVSPIPQPVLSPGNGVCFNADNRKRKAVEISECSSGNSGNSSMPGSESGIERRNSSGKGKKMRGNDKEKVMPKEVVHVRARRGQATDSHSLAERVRRGKINERLRCLQDIVPGCYKTMGMAVMLDEIINYVQSLQNQVEFLSMKLTAASSVYDFNTETTDTIEALQRAKANEAQKVQRLMSGSYEEVGSTQVGPLDLTFGAYPSLPMPYTTTSLPYTTS